MKSVHNTQAGQNKTVLIVVVAAALVALGAGGWWFFMKDKDVASVVNTPEAKQIVDACKKTINDNDLCRFFGSWDANQKFAVEMTTASNGSSSKSTYKVDGEKMYIKTDGDYAMEMITIGDDTYTKAGDVWWKKTNKPDAPAADTTTAEVADRDQFKFDEPTADKTTGPQYKKLGKEACGSFTCFKYQMIDTTSSGETVYLWFDDSKFLMRKMSTESSDGSRMEQVYSYENVSVPTPSPVKELAENQYIVPGQTEPMTLPSFEQ